jgi:hypothetical protein
MAIFTATGAQLAVQPKGLRVGLTAVKSTYSIANTLSAGDVYQMVKVPQNATPIYVQFGCNNGTPSYLIEVGDGIVSGRYRSIATFSAAIGMVVASINVTPYTYSTDDTIDVTFSTITASNASLGGAFYMNVIFSMDAT